MTNTHSTAGHTEGRAGTTPPATTPGTTATQLPCITIQLQAADDSVETAVAVRLLLKIAWRRFGLRGVDIRVDD